MIPTIMEYIENYSESSRLTARHALTTLNVSADYARKHTVTMRQMIIIDACVYMYDGMGEFIRSHASIATQEAVRDMEDMSIKAARNSLAVHGVDQSDAPSDFAVCAYGYGMSSAASYFRTLMSNDNDLRDRAERVAGRRLERWEWTKVINFLKPQSPGDVSDAMLQGAVASL